MASDAGANSNAKITIFKMVFEKPEKLIPGLKNRPFTESGTFK